MNERKTITLFEANARNNEKRMATPVDFCLEVGEHLAIVGENGSGKTLLVDLITGKSPLREGTLQYDFGTDECGVEIPQCAYGNIAVVTFEDALGTVEKPYYFQQRFNSQDRDESPLLEEVLKRSLVDVAEDAPLDEMLDIFQMRPLLEKRMVTLSSGEMRRYHLFKHLVRHPRVLIVDNPFIGLDAPMREQLGEFFQQLVSQRLTQLILVQSKLDDVPPYLTHVVEVKKERTMATSGGVVGAKMTRETYLMSFRSKMGTLSENHRFSGESEYRKMLRAVFGENVFQAVNGILDIPTSSIANLTKDGRVSDEIIAVRHLSLTLPDADRVLYGGLDWTVRRGECWALQGANGSGKSTLLSLISADHPAAYACDISLFGRRRGTGESIWEIKRHIGFVSPEFHRAYKQNRPAIEIVASGIHDSVGLYKRPRPEQMDICRFWMQVFAIDHLRDRLFLTLSSGEQRLCLLARAFVKDPALLILDEPLHGLDSYRRELVRHIIRTFRQRPDKTLIMVTHYPEELPEGFGLNLTL